MTARDREGVATTISIHSTNQPTTTDNSSNLTRTSRLLWLLASSSPSRRLTSRGASCPLRRRRSRRRSRNVIVRDDDDLGILPLPLSQRSWSRRGRRASGSRSKGGYGCSSDNLCQLDGGGVVPRSDDLSSTQCASIVSRFQRQPHTRSFKVKIGLEPSFGNTAVRRRRAGGYNVEGGDEGDSLNDLGVEQGEIDGPVVVSSFLEGPRIGMVDELPGIRLDWSSRLGAEKSCETSESGVRKRVEIEFSVGEGMDGGKTEAGGHLF